MGRRARRLDLDPHQALLAEAHDVGEPTSPQMLASPLACGTCSIMPAGAERAHVLLVAGERQHDLARPGVAMSCEQRSRQQRAGDAAFHVADAAAVELAVLQHAAQRRHGPAAGPRDREGVEMAVEDQALARPRARGARPIRLTTPGAGSMRSTSIPGDRAASAPRRPAATSCVSLGGFGEATATRRCSWRSAPSRAASAALVELVAEVRSSADCRRRSHQRMPMASGQQIRSRRRR